jgi:hypothetical protein
MRLATLPQARVSDDRSNRLVGDILMSLKESKQSSPFVNRSGGGLYGGNNLMDIIDHPMACSVVDF